MKTAWIGATLVVACAGGVTLGAGTTAALKGADTLFDLTSAIIAACPGATGPYAGGGSAHGESAMLAGAQQVAPMSRFLDSYACSGPAAAPTQSQGLVIGLDGVVLVGDRTTIGSPACNGDPNTSCVSTFEPSNGAAYNTSIVGTDGVTYTFHGWRDVLRVLLAGFDHDNIGTGPAQWSKRDCYSPVRQALAQSYGAFFENNCAAAAGEATVDMHYNPVCTQIRHVFRPGDYSAASDLVVALLGLPPIVYPDILVGGVLQHTGASPFCNAVRPAFVFPDPRPTALQGSDATWDPTSTEFQWSNGLETAVYRAPMQDNDPIRRLCAGSGTRPAPAEDVCSHSGDLGLVLPINDVEEIAPRTNADRYNATRCDRGKMASVAAPDVYDAITQTKLVCAKGLLCPNADTCNAFGGCFAPADASGSPQCLANKLTKPILTISVLAKPNNNPQAPWLSDGRTFNKHLYVDMGGAGAYQMLSSTARVPVTGAYHRIHASHSVAPVGDSGVAVTCQQPDVSDQIGCLVSASPCSLGYGGLRMLTANPSAAPVKINKQSPSALCIQAHFLYPLARKVYLNSVPGFAAVGGEELQLAGCMTDLAQTSHNPATPPGLVAANVAVSGLIPIPPFVNGGAPFCEDFDEMTLCGAANNVDSCRGPTPNFDSFPGFETTCGNGLIEPYEDCDDSTANGAPPARCSSTCRFHR
jgi:cysteine-rich repeat protein